MGTTVITVDISTFVLFLFGVINLLVLGPVAWILKGAINDLRQLERRHEFLKDDMQTRYLRVERYVDDIKRLEDLVRGLYDKLDSKADKT